MSTPSEDEWLVYTVAHGPRDLRLWWKPGGSGYTVNVNRAGVFTREQAERTQRTRSPLSDGSPADLAVKRYAVLATSFPVSSTEDDGFPPEDRLPAAVRTGFGPSP